MYCPLFLFTVGVIDDARGDIAVDDARGGVAVDDARGGVAVDGARGDVAAVTDGVSGCSTIGHLCGCVSPVLASPLVFSLIKPRRCLRAPPAPGSRHVYRNTTVRTSFRTL